jgi:glutamate-ammonia-ligase adenylyltransferase
LDTVRELLAAESFGPPERQSLEVLGLREPKRAWSNLASIRDCLKPHDPRGDLLPALVAELLMGFDPDLALTSAERFLSALKDPRVLVSLLRSDPWNLRAIGACLSGSPYLSEMLISDPSLLDEVFLTGILRRSILKDELHREVARRLENAATMEEAMKVLRRFRHLSFLRIGLRDLLREADFNETVEDLSNLADVCLDVGLSFVERHLRARFGEPRYVDRDGVERPGEFCVIGMGKLGGKELNFSSDIDLLYVYASERGTTSGVKEPSGRVVGQISLHEYYTRLSQELTRLMSERTADGVVFRVDLGLRPEGSRGDICASLRTYELYYESWGETWERQALLKARPVAGSLALGETFLKTVQPFVFRKYLDFDAIQEIRRMKERLDHRLRLSRSKRGRHVKLGTGGIREIEFIIQAFQMLYAGRDKWLREKNSLRALHRLSDRGLITFTEYSNLTKAYIFLRELEHRIQMTYGLQTHTIPEDEASQASLARKMGLSGETQRELAAALIRAYDRHTAQVRSVYDKFFYTQDVEEAAFPEEEYGWLLDPDLRPEATERLRALGFAHPERAANDFILLHDGPPHSHPSARSKLLFRRLVPALLDGLKTLADPDMALRHLEEFISTSGAREMHFSMLLEHPNLLRHLLSLFGHSEYLSRILIYQPDLFTTLVDPDIITRPVEVSTFEQELERSLSAVENPEQRIQELRRLKKAAELRIGLRHLWGECGLMEALRELTAVAEGCLRCSLEWAEQEVRMLYGQPMEGQVRRGRPAGICIIGLGKLGGGELDYGSDLDLMFVFSAEGSTDGRGRLGESIRTSTFFARVAERVIHILSSMTQSGYAYKVDTGLRPDGTKAPLVHSLEGIESYYRQRGQLWERQAMIKARPVAGDPEFGRSVTGLLEQFAYGAPLSAQDLESLDAMRRRMEKERTRETLGRRNFKLGRGGLADIEFTCQILQLAFGTTHPEIRTPNTMEALQRLSAAGFLKASEGDTLKEAYQFLRQVENQLRVERDHAVEHLPALDEKLAALARRMGFKGPDPSSQAQNFLETYDGTTGQVRNLYETILSRLRDTLPAGAS